MAARTEAEREELLREAVGFLETADGGEYGCIGCGDYGVHKDGCRWLSWMRRAAPEWWRHSEHSLPRDASGCLVGGGGASFENAIVSVPFDLPAYPHGCEHCRFLGTIEHQGPKICPIEKWDLYFCHPFAHERPVVVIRSGCSSSMEFLDLRGSAGYPPFDEAVRRAVERGLWSPEVPS